MSQQLIFIPVLIQITLTLGLYILLAIAKSRALKLGNVNEDRRGLHDDAWPDSVLKINNCIRNQFETPVLFYVLVLLFAATGSVTPIVHTLAWLFVLSRLIHAYIHTGSNYVPLRRKVFTFGCLLLIILSIFAAKFILFD
jgi:hypothetical protein